MRHQPNISGFSLVKHMSLMVDNHDTINFLEDSLLVNQNFDKSNFNCCMYSCGMGSQHQLVKSDLDQGEGEGAGGQYGHHRLCREHPHGRVSASRLSNKSLE